MVSPDKGLISLFAIAVSHEIRGNVVKKNWTLIAGESTCAGPYLCHDSCSDKTPSFSTTPLCLFVCLSLFLYQDHDGNWTPV